MVSCVAITDYAAVVGKTNDTDWALQLDRVPVAPTLLALDGQLRQINRLAGIDNDVSFDVRLLKLLCRLRLQLQSMPDNAPVLLVLPEQLADEQALAGMINVLQQQFPSLLSHKACQLFPYGSSAALMALATASQLLASGEPVVWIIGLDSPVTTLAGSADCQIGRCLLTAGQLSDAVVWSEGAVAVALQQSDYGLCWQYLASDATISNATAELALAHLFTAAATSTDGSLQRLYLPDNGSEELTACWQPHYPRLAPLMNKATQLSFPAYSSGELGAAGGVYRFLQLYQRYLERDQRGLTLQCEISTRLYRAVAVFSWQHAGGISEH